MNELFTLLKEQGARFGESDGTVKIKLPKDLRSDIKKALVDNKSAFKEYLQHLFSSTKSSDTIRPRAAGTKLPASNAQKRLWFLDNLKGRSEEYNIPSAFKISGMLDVDILNRVFSEIIARHEVLRTTYYESNGEIYQDVLPIESTVFSVTEYDLSHSDAAAVDTIIDKDVCEPFDLASDLMLRVSYLKVSDQSSMLVLNMHHIASDGWSSDVIKHEFFSLYQSFSNNESNPLPSIEVQYGDYACWLNEESGKAKVKEQITYWESQLDSAPPVHGLLLDFPRPKSKQFEGQLLHGSLGTAQAKGVIQAAKYFGMTPFMFIHALFSLLLARHSNSDDIVLGTPYANRNRSEIAPLIGFFVNTMVLRAKTDFSSFYDYIEHIKEVNLGAQSNQDVPFEQIVEVLNLPRDLSYMPIFQIMLTANVQEEASSSLLCGLDVTPVDSQIAPAKFDLNVDFNIDPSTGIGLTWTYDVSLFSEPHIAQLNQHMCTIISYFSSCELEQDISLADIPMLSESEVQHLVTDLNETVTQYPKTKCIHTLFEAYAEKEPDKIALRFGEQVLSYGELNSKSNKLANYLRDRCGVGSGSLVGLCMPRCVDMVVGMLGILKAGGAYVPLDLGYPSERLAFIVDDAQVKTVLCTKDSTAKLRDINATCLELDERKTQQTIDAYECTSLGQKNTGVGARDLAYIIYTSGSTGAPKGVMTPHIGVVRLVVGQSFMELNDRTIMMQCANIAFDAATLELWGVLLNGGCSVLYEHQHVEPSELNNAINQYGVNSLWLTAGLFSEWSHYAGEVPNLSQLVAGGDALDIAAVNRTQIALPDLQLINGYGPTENTTFSCTYSFPAGGQHTFAPIGKRLLSDKMYILDKHGALVPYGSVGELFVAGDGVAKGYLNQRQLTDTQFINNTLLPGGTVGYDRLYKTGDLVRYLPDGNLEFVGRADGQVKIRGFRIELGELEAQLLKLMAVESTLVMVHGEGNAKQIVAYVKLAKGANSCESTIDSINLELQKHMPKYMLPSHILPIASWPLTANGKIDRKALPSIDLNLSSSAYIAPGSANELLVARVWGDVLNMDMQSISRTDNFFTLGGHSLSAIRVVSKLRELADIELPLNMLFDHPTLEALAHVIEQEILKDDYGVITLPSITKHDETVALIPLSYSQKRLRFIDKLNNGSAEYNLPAAYVINGTIDLTVLQKTFASIVERHEVLRTNFYSHDGSEFQRVKSIEDIDFEIEQRDISALDINMRESELSRFMDQEIRRPFNLASDLMIRVYYVRTSDGGGVLLFNMHHIASDGWSVEILKQEFFTLYQAYSQNMDNPLPKLNIQYSDYAFWQRKYVDDIALESQKSYWVEKLDGLPLVHNLPLDNPRPKVKGVEGAIYNHTLEGDIATHFKQAALQQNMTPFMLFYAALAIVIARNSRSNDVVIGTPVANRTQKEVENLIGFFVNTLVLRVDTDHDSLGNYLSHVRETHLMAQANQDMPFEQIVDALEVPRTLSYTPLFQVMLTTASDFGGASSDEMQLDGISLEAMNDSVIYSKFDINVDINIVDSGIDIKWIYDKQLFSGEYIEQLNGHLCQLIQSLVSIDDLSNSRLNELKMLPPDEQLLLQTELNGESVPYSSDKCIHELIEQKVISHSDSIAVAFEGVELTYSELNSLSNQLAQYLVSEKNITPESKVGICLDRSIEMVVAILAVLKAGGAYVPLDPNYPAERLSYMVNEAELRCVFCDKAGLSALRSAAVETIQIDGVASGKPHFASHYNIENLSKEQTGVTSENLAYIIFTSGSTGNPKGVQIEHKALVNSTENRVSVYGNMNSFLLLSSISFDSSIAGIFYTLICGGKLCISGQVLEAEYVSKAITEQKISHLLTTPSFYQTLMQCKQVSDWSSLECVTVAGEACLDETVQLHERLLPLVKLKNEYGPTEAAVWCSHADLSSDKPVSIGKAIDNYQFYVLDESGSLAPYGAIGELCIGGDGLARGYLNRDDLTALSFIPNPFYNLSSNNCSKRLYKTGDLVRYLSDGSLEFIGRKDHQVKVRGFRIEVGEVERTLTQSMYVESCFVTAIGQGTKTALGAFVKLCDEVEHSQQVMALIKSHLSLHLPEYMRPTKVAIIEEWPLSPNGKINRKALLERDLHSFESSEYIEPRNAAEQKLSEIWEDILSVNQVSILDNFFALGGHSLLVMELVSKARAVGLNLSAKDVFASETLEQLATAVTVNPVVEAFVSPTNGITPESKVIDPSMLPLTNLSQAEIDTIAGIIPGGVENIQDIYALSPMQEGFLFHSMLEDHDDPYVTRLVFQMEDTAITNTLISAFEKVVERHDVLRTAIVWDSLSHPVQVVSRKASLEVRSIDLPCELDSSEYENYLNTVSLPVLDLQTAPLIKVYFAPVPNTQKQYLIIQEHHSINDHVGHELLIEELFQLTQNITEELPAPAQYREHIAYAQYLDKRYDSKEYFNSLLGDIDSGTYPFGICDVKGLEGTAMQHTVDLPLGISNEIREISRQYQISPAIFFHSAWAIFTAKTSGSHNALFGTVLSGRVQNSSEVSRVMGCLLNTLPFHISLVELTVDELLNKVSQLLRDMLNYEHTSLVNAQQCSAIPSGTPLFSALLNYRHSEEATSDTDAHMLSSIKMVASKDTSNYPIDVSIDELGIDKGFGLQAQTIGVDAHTVLSYFSVVISGLVNALKYEKTKPSLDLDILPDSDQELILNNWNKTAKKYNDIESIHELVAQTALQFSGNTAVESPNEKLTYTELDQRSTEVAKYLLHHSHVMPGDIIGLQLKCAAQRLVALLGVWKSGACALMLDENQPIERRRHIVNDSGMVELFVDEADAISFSDTAARTAAYGELASLLSVNHELQLPNVDGKTPAIVFYTSGSTGAPKGAVFTHEGLVNYANSMHEVLELGQDDRFLQIAPVGFDVILEEILPCWVGGGAVVIPEPSSLIDPAKLNEFIKQQSITGIELSLGQWREWLNWLNAKGDTPSVSLKQVLVGCETIPERLLTQWLHFEIPVVSVFGLTETTITNTVWRSDQNSFDRYQLMPIGKPLANNQVYILDKNMRLVPPGVIGEMYIGGFGVASGYLNLPDLTAERFIHNPFSVEDGSDRIYKTGDLARYHSDGNIEFLGRTDNQVKLRGYRIELGEIEEKLARVPGIAESVVVARSDIGTEKVLVAYIVGKPNTVEETLITDAKKLLQDTLPTYMHPSFWCVLSGLPLTQNGKLDVKSLPEPKLSEHKQCYVAPSSSSEVALCEIWQKILGIEVVGVNDNFFGLGGHSLLAMNMIAEASKVGITIDAKSIFATDTLAELAQVIDKTSGQVGEEFTPPTYQVSCGVEGLGCEQFPLVNLTSEELANIIKQIPGGEENIKDIYPLGPLQKGFVYHSFIKQDVDPYITNYTLKIASKEKLDGFIAAIERIVDRHDALRTAVIYEDISEPVQVVSHKVQLSVQWLSLKAASDDAEYMDQLTSHVDKAFSLNQAPLMKLYIAKMQGTGAYLVGLQQHHLITDHIAGELMLNELAAFMAGHGSALSKPRQYREHIAYIQHLENKGDAASYLKDQFSDIEEGTYPFGLIDVKEEHGVLDESQYDLSEFDSKAIRFICKQLNVSPAAFFHAVWALVVSACSGKPDVIFGTVLSGRVQAGKGVQEIMGCLLNTLPLRVKLGAVTKHEYIQAIQKSLNEVLEYEYLSLSEAQAVSGLISDTPMFSALINYRLSGSDHHDTEEAELGHIELLNTIESTTYPFYLSVDDYGVSEGFKLTAQTVGISSERVIAYVKQVMKSLLESTGEPLTNIQILPNVEHEQTISTWNNTHVSFSDDKCIHTVFEEQVLISPLDIALQYESESLNYQTLNHKVNQFANYLVTQCDVKKNTLVGLCLERSVEMVIGILGILKAGGAYVPLDPAHPEERIDFMLGDASLGIVITDGQGARVMEKKNVPCVNLTDRVVREKIAAQASDNLDIDSGPGDLAYVIYTSGSTGKPKGVMIEHQALVNRIDWMHQEYGCNKSDRILQKTPYSFDVSVWEFMWPLSVGACLVMAKPGGHQDPKYLASVINTYAVTKMHFVPSMLSSMLFSEYLTECHSLKQVFCSGESLTAKQVTEFHKQCPWSELHNLYGPTEAAIDVSYWDCKNFETETTIIPIGKPIQNTQLYVLNELLQPAPVGVVGELYIGGVGLARGYLNRTELTNERFIENPYFDTENQYSSARLYRTGDLVRWLEDGNIEYIGRNDFQVKIRGLRIELGEIESALLKHQNISEALVLAEGTEGNTNLVGYYTTFKDCDESEIIASLMKSLPNYMVPSMLIHLEDFPRNANGKVDRGALPSASLETQVVEFIEPRTTVERSLALIWEKVLDVPKVSMNDNFFALGGHSLLVMNMVSYARKQGIELEPLLIYKTDSLSELAKHIENADTVEVKGLPIPDYLIPEGAKELTPSMLPLIELNEDELRTIENQIPGGVENILDIYPLGPLQKGFVFHSMAQDGDDPYISNVKLKIDSTEKLAGLVESINRIIQRHDVLRTAIIWQGLSSPVQVVCREAKIMAYETTFLPGESKDEYAKKLDQFAVTSMDITKAPLFNLVIGRVEGSEDAYLLIQQHHLINDHVSLELLINEISKVLSGEVDTLPIPNQYREQIAYIQHIEKKKNPEEHFSQMLSDVTEGTYPFAVADVYGSGQDIDVHSWALEDELSEAVRRCTKNAGVSAAAFFHAVWGMVVAATSNSADVLIGTVLSGRVQAKSGANYMMGCLINTLPVRFNLASQTASDYLQSVAKTLNATTEYEYYSLLEAQNLSGLAQGSPLFSALINYRHTATEMESDDAAIFDGIEHLESVEHTNYPFEFAIDDFGKGEAFGLTVHASEQFSVRISRFIDQSIKSLLGALDKSASQDLAVINLPSLDICEIDRVLKCSVQSVGRQFPDKLIHELFEERVTQSPESIAISDGEQYLSYAELNAAANKFAYTLRSEVVNSADTLIGICMDRSIEMVVAILGVLKSGAAYVPLSPELPEDRLKHILSSSCLTSVIVHTQYSSLLAMAIDKLYVIDNLDSLSCDHSLPNLQRMSEFESARNLAYVIHTSGSTGIPKGVSQTHATVVNLIQETIALNEPMSTLQFAPYSFDVSVQEIFSALASGSTLELITDTQKADMDAVIEVINERKVERLFIPPAFLQFIVQHEIQCVKRIYVAGERLIMTPQIRQFMLEHSSCRVFNHYGPTETHVVTEFELSATQEGAVPIGKPIMGIDAYVCNKYEHLAPLGVIGELLIGGYGVARGYINQKVVTDTSFVNVPFSEGKLYKTGDLVRYLPDGNLEYIDRLDEQVQIRGFRVEIGEIETHLSNVDAVDSCVVVAKDYAGSKKLVAYIKLKSLGSVSNEIEIESLQGELRNLLPEYMIPTGFIFVQEWSLTPNGKIDKRALLSMEEELTDSDYIAPKNDIERELVELWGKVLGVPCANISRNAHFFELGGHSLALINLLSSIKEGLNIEQIKLSVLLENPILSEQASQILYLREVHTKGESSEEFEEEVW